MAKYFEMIVCKRCVLLALFSGVAFFSSAVCSYACVVGDKNISQDKLVSLGRTLENKYFCTDVYILYPATRGHLKALPPILIADLDNQYSFEVTLDATEDHAYNGKDSQIKLLRSSFCLSDELLKKARIEIWYWEPNFTENSYKPCIDDTHDIILENLDQLLAESDKIKAESKK